MTTNIGRGPLSQMPKAPSREIFPLSFNQERIWFAEKFHPNSTLFSVPVALWLEGELNVVALEHSLNDILARHESLRTTFKEVHAEPMQKVGPHTNNCTLDVIDFVGQEERAELFLHDEIRRPFDLNGGPLVRFHLIRTAERRFLFILNTWIRDNDNDGNIQLFEHLYE